MLHIMQTNPHAQWLPLTPAHTHTQLSFGDGAACLTVSFAICKHTRTQAHTLTPTRTRPRTHRHGWIPCAKQTLALPVCVCGEH